MSKREQVDIAATRFSVRVSQYISPEDLEWLPDAAEFFIVVQEADGSVTEHRYGYTCLEHTFLLRNRLETRESGSVLWGTGGTDVSFDGETVTLFGSPAVVGTVEDVRLATDDLLSQMFTYLHQHDIDTRDIVRNIAGSRFGPWDIDPVAIHDQLVQ